MTLRLEMLEAARRAPELLGESAPLVPAFLLRQQNPDGGFRNRGGASDVYYVPFALGGLAALGSTAGAAADAATPLEDVLARVEAYLIKLEEPRRLDFVHLCSLMRSRAALASLSVQSSSSMQPLLDLVESYRAADGGYNPQAGRECGTAYGGFLAVGAYQDAQVPVPEPDRLVNSIELLRTAEGGYFNERPCPSAGAHQTGPGGVAGTNPTAAAVSVLRHLAQPVAPAVSEWLLARVCRSGGFSAGPATSTPDLLSTATALHALSQLDTSIQSLKEPTLDFLDSLWSSEGGFYGHWGDDQVDSEYTFYGLVALGQLAASR